MEWVHHLHSSWNSLRCGSGVPLEAIHGYNLQSIAKFLVALIKPASKDMSATTRHNIQQACWCLLIVVWLMMLGHINNDGHIAIAMFAPIMGSLVFIDADDTDIF